MGQSVGWMERVEQHKYFLAIVTEDYFLTKQHYAKVLYAISLGKPIVLLIKGNISLPEEMFAQADIIALIRYDSAEELHEALGLVCEKVLHG
jgi:hypothetical protein